MWAMSSQLPLVQEASPADERLKAGTGAAVSAEGNAEQAAEKEEKIVKVSWWRPHGQTAIAPGELPIVEMRLRSSSGLKRITLKVRIEHPSAPFAAATYSDSPGTSLQRLVDSDGAPTSEIMKHLLDIFFLHFGCQFPFLDRQILEDQVDRRNGSVFMMNCVAGLAAR